MKYLSILEVDGNAYGGYIPELSLMVGGDNFDEVRRLLAEGIPFALEDPGDNVIVPPRAQKWEDFSEDIHEAFANSDIRLEFIEAAKTNPVSEEIARLMQQEQLTQAAFAARLGTSQSAVSRMVNPFYWGHSLSMLRRIADTFGAELTIKLERP